MRRGGELHFLGTPWLGLPCLLALPLGGCSDDGVTIDPSTIVEMDLGPQALDARGLSGPVSLPPPPGAESLTLVGSDPGAGEILFGLTAPDGAILTDDTDRCGALSGVVRHYAQAGTSILQVPNDDRHALADGVYSVVLRAFAMPSQCTTAPAPATGPVALRALWKTVPLDAAGRHGALRGQRLALNVFLVGGVKRTRLLGPALDRLRALFARAHVEVGGPTILELPDPEGRFARVDLDDRDTQLRAILQAAGGGPSDGVNIVFVGEITAGPGFTIYGVAAGIPGAPARGGERSGVLVSSIIIDPVAFDSQFPGNVMAHETGHFLGLFHTTEADYTWDPIDDTPACPRFKDGNGNGLNRHECLDYDGNNLMFWEGESFGGKEAPAYGTLTPGQQAVILRSAATR